MPESVRCKYFGLLAAIVCVLCGCAGKNAQGPEETQTSLQEGSERPQQGAAGEMNDVGQEEARDRDTQESLSGEQDTGDTQEEPACGNGTEDGQEPAAETIADYRASFYREALPDSVKKRITGVSYPADDADVQISYQELAYVHVLYYDFDGEVQEGELVCNQAIADDLTEIFRELYENRYQIEKIRLVDEYGGDDDASMEDNNTSCFNYRPVMGTDRLSKHAYGLAVDVNPLYNPYITTRNGKTTVSPENGAAYADRSREFAHKIDENDLCYQLFSRHGFSWGGSWVNSKDYQHFQKEP